jgi:iron complex outermembrane recepter protein
MGQSAWLESWQQTTGALAPFNLAGTVFNPPHFRTRDGLTWQNARLTLSGFVNFTGGVTNVLTTPNSQGGSMTTVDLSGLYHFLPSTGPLANVDLSLAVLNLADVRPPHLQNPASYAPQFDSTNYSDVGRFVSLSIRKHL